jgi:hypothetical protein
MKEAFALVVLIVTPSIIFAQGTVGFINYTAGLVRQWTSPSDPTLISVPVSGAHVELFTAPNDTSLTPIGGPYVGGFYWNFSTLAGFLAANPGWSDIATTGIQPVAGRFNGGIVSLLGIPGGATAEYFILGWTGTATTFDAAILTPGTWFGSSPLLTTLTGNPSTTPQGTPIPLSATFTGLILGTPEPSTFALAGLGLAALLVLRRRR